MSAILIQPAWSNSSVSSAGTLGAWCAPVINANPPAFAAGVSMRTSITLPNRAPDFVSALTQALRDAGVTALFNAELSTLAGPELRVPLPAISVALDNMVLLRYFEMGSHLQRLVSVLKVRESAFDPAIRNFAIGDRGITIGDPFTGATALLTGTPVPMSTAGDQA